MLVVLSPAKTLDLSAIDDSLPISVPSMQADVQELLPLLCKQSVADLKRMFAVSEAVAKLNYERFKNFETNSGKRAAFAFDGPAYKSLDITTLEKEELKFCQKHLRILCGLYGVLRPCDDMKPYRLEMSTKLPNARGKDLYMFWGDRITDFLNKELAAVEPAQRFLVNCASQEYFKSINVGKIDGIVYHMQFPGPSVFAKQARGMMVRYICQHMVDSPDKLKDFTGTGGEWRFDAKQSTDTNFVFMRSAAPKKQTSSKLSNTSLSATKNPQPKMTSQKRKKPTEAFPSQELDSTETRPRRSARNV